MTTWLLPAVNFRRIASGQIARPGPRIPAGVAPAASAAGTADEAVIKLYGELARPLVGLAALLVWMTGGPGVPVMAGSAVTAESFMDFRTEAGAEAGELAALIAVRVPEAVSGMAEEIVHDAFTAMHHEWRKLRDLDRATAFLRRAIVHGSRARERQLASQAAAQPGDGRPGAGGRMLAVLRRLPGRQCEALVLRYYAGLPEAQAAAAMGVTRAAFRGHASRGMAALQWQLGPG
ncbi:MAG TPA: sigma factor-like helix-turn-helix DNA-binding protein [Trebonia sp.]|jgi:DNA-directed RNA polymerase specialized sigma24 family protein|nr:sigma factor-like helix-turn-helix DNA-binding protein [Trebonia sp.]